MKIIKIIENGSLNIAYTAVDSLKHILLPGSQLGGWRGGGNRDKAHTYLPQSENMPPDIKICPLNILNWQGGFFFVEYYTHFSGPP